MGTLPVAGKEKEEVKRTNEIKTTIPLLEAIAIEGKEISADALLTQRELADYKAASQVGSLAKHFPAKFRASVGQIQNMGFAPAFS